MTSLYLDSHAAAAYVRKPSIKAFNRWVSQRGIHEDGRCGRRRLFKVATLDRVLRMDAQKGSAHVG